MKKQNLTYNIQACLLKHDDNALFYDGAVISLSTFFYNIKQVIMFM